MSHAGWTVQWIEAKGEHGQPDASQAEGDTANSALRDVIGWRGHGIIPDVI